MNEERLAEIERSISEHYDIVQDRYGSADHCDCAREDSIELIAEIRRLRERCEDYCGICHP